MIDLNKVTAFWMKSEDGWLIAPAGLTWIGEGSHLKIGNECQLGDGCQLGNECRLGDWCQLGDGCQLGNECRLGNECQLGNGCQLGDGCRLGDRALDPIDIGYADGYRKCVCNVSGVAYIGAGCRWFCLADALEHWSDRDDRDMTNCLMMAAIHIAAVKGWAHE